MNLDDFPKVADAALSQIEGLLKSWLPKGVREGIEFCIGSRSGEAGKSMRIRLTGEKAGYWSDFSSDGEAGRDLISLFAYINDLPQGKACAKLAAQLGVALADDRKGAAAPVLKKDAMKPAPAQAPQGVKEKKPRTEWEPQLPVPPGSGPYPAAHPKRGRPDRVWEYRGQDGELLGVIYRFTTSDGGKEILPCVYAQHPVTMTCMWRWMSFRDPRPLYMRTRLRPELPVLLVEGEKCVDAAFDVVGTDWNVVSWPGGGKAIAKTDWSLLAGYHVVLWADADAKAFKSGHPQAGQLMPELEQPGMSAMRKAEGFLLALDCTVEYIDIPAPGIEPDGWDVADYLAAGATRADVDAFLARRRPIERAPVDAPAGVDESTDESIPDWVIGGVPDPDDKSTASAAYAKKVSRADVRGMMLSTDKGGVLGCRENVYTALMHDQCLIGLVALDQFSVRQVKRRGTPWPSDPGEWTEGDDFHLGRYLANHYGLLIGSVGEIEKAVAQAARENGFNPVIDMLDEAAEAWDGVPRVECAFTTYWGSVDSEYLRLVSTMFFVGLAKRAYVPGVKHDYAPVFEGPQGEGKSTALSILGGEWFADTPFQMGDKDSYLAIQGILIYEIAELEQFNRSEITAIKAFMSSQVDRYREPYGRRMRNQKRRTVFAGTTNEDKYFKDPTGNRRFWPVVTGVLDLDALRRDRLQLLGEAVHMMRAKVKWFPTREEQLLLITPMQESREVPDDWIGAIWNYVEGLDFEGKPNRAEQLNRVTAREIIVRALHIEIGKISQAKTETNRISNIFRKLGWKKGRETSGAREYYYERPAPEAPAPQADVVDTEPEEKHEIPF